MDQCYLKDRKILYELDLNSRQSYAQIGKKIGLSKEVVKYRIEHMQKHGIITLFSTEVDTYKLGYYCFRIYINFIEVNTEMKNKIIRYFMDYKNSWNIITAKGPVDFAAVLWVKDIFEFNQFWNNTLEKYGNYFDKYAISILNQVIVQNHSFLILEEHKPLNRTHHIQNCKGNPVPIDLIDYQLLNEIVINARLPLVDLGKKLNCTAQTIQNRIKNLIMKDVIQGFQVGIDYTKLGMQSCTIDIYLKDFSKRTQILEYVKSVPYVSDIMDMTIGWSDFQFEIIVNSIDTLNQIMDDIENKFPGAIRKMNFWMSKKLHKYRPLPEMTDADFKKLRKIT